MKKATYLLSLVLLIIATSCEKITLINFSELPAVSQRFIEDNFKGANIDTAEKLVGEPRYRVTLNNGYKIWFYENGDWQKLENREDLIISSLLNNLLPQNIIAFLAEKYPKSGVISIWKDDIGYHVMLNNPMEKVLDFDKSGNIIPETTE